MFRRFQKFKYRKILKEYKRIKMEFAQIEDSAAFLFSEHLHQNLEWIKNEFHASPDLIVRQFILGLNEKRVAAILFIDGLVDQKKIDRSILEPLMAASDTGLPVAPDLLSYIESSVITVGEVKYQKDLAQLPDCLVRGGTVLLIDGTAGAICIPTPGWEKRAITEPDSEVNIRGPREGFAESLRTNTAMLRRYIGHPDLTFIPMTIGEKTKTDVSIAYLRGIANESLIAEIQRRLRRIKTDMIVGAGEVEQFIEDSPLSLFSLIGFSERPDVVTAKLFEGRAAIIVNGSPEVLTMPFLLTENFQYPDDYNFHFIYGSLIRITRYAAFLTALMAPAAYVALATYHQELLPTPLFITMAAATEGTPFPKVIEVLGMGLVFELIREGGIRLPRPIGSAIGIVGALVIGQATVEAGFISAPTVIVTAVTAVATFVFPSLVDETTPLRIFLVMITGFLGAFGLLICLLILLIHLASLRSFGVLYLAPLSPLNIRSLAQDTLIRAPWWMMWKRPRMITENDPERQNFRLMPRPQNDSGEKS